MNEQKSPFRKVDDEAIELVKLIAADACYAALAVIEPGTAQF